MTDEQRMMQTDLVGGTSSEEDILFALNYLLNFPDDELPLFADNSE